MTAASATPGKEIKRSSTCAGLMFSPPRMMMSFILPVIRIFPESSILARSPVLKNPSLVKDFLFSSGFFK
jgi:hypothetical protein